MFVGNLGLVFHPIFESHKNRELEMFSFCNFFASSNLKKIIKRGYWLLPVMDFSACILDRWP